ncbi:hypothetical protein AA313_de0207533 [Arthrobotrys entomopaga]|nr:hypothetical protein AA313_de0207533 [Arthrobotrys entomopaga]
MENGNNRTKLLLSREKSHSLSLFPLCPVRLSSSLCQSLTSLSTKGLTDKTSIKEGKGPRDRSTPCLAFPLLPQILKLAFKRKRRLEVPIYYGHFVFFFYLSQIRESRRPKGKRLLIHEAKSPDLHARSSVFFFFHNL